jgi:hypothetical protein
MKRTRIVAFVVGVPLAALVWWIASNTYWADTTVPMLPKGEALRNPFYAAQRLAEALGASTARDRALTIPAANAVIVLSAWHWSLSRGRREALEGWVESGGRLIVDSDVIGGEGAFEEWSGIVRDHREPDAARRSVEPARRDPCHTFREVGDATLSSISDESGYRMCGVDVDSFFTTRKSAAWALGDRSGIQAIRVPVGLGSVTAINARPFVRRSLFDGDHGWLFVMATQLRRGDEVHFLSEDEHPSLLALLWQHGGPVVVLSLACVALVLWRGGVRFGPLAPPYEPARRSLAEQILGTGQFALRQGGGEALHAAAVRALDEAAQRRIPGYPHLSAKDRAAALARLTGFERNTIAAAVHNPRSRRPHELRGTIALLEAARRTVIEHTRIHHGRH